MESLPTRPCFFCKAELPADALKCRHCGEWADGARVLSGVSKFLLGVVAAEISSFVLAGAQWLPAIRLTLADFAARPPAFTRLTLSPWWIWGWLIALVSGSAAVVNFVRRTRPRDSWLVLVAIAGLAVLIATLWGAYLPIFAIAGSIRE